MCNAKMFMAIMFSIAPRILMQRYRRMKVHGDAANMAVVIILSTRGVVGIARDDICYLAQDTWASGRSFLLLLIVGRLTGSEVSFLRRPTRRIYFQRRSQQLFLNITKWLVWRPSRECSRESWCREDEEAVAVETCSRIRPVYRDDVLRLVPENSFEKCSAWRVTRMSSNFSCR